MYPIANVPVPQAGINIPFMQQAAYPAGLLLGGLLPMLLGNKNKTNPLPQADNAAAQISPDQPAAAQPAQNVAQPAQPTQAPQPDQTAAQPQQTNPQDLGAQIKATLAPLLAGSGGLGGLGGMGGMGGAGAAPAAPAAVRPNNGAFRIQQPSYAGTGINPQLLQMYSQGGMQPNQFGGVSGPAGLNPLAQMQRRLAMLSLTGNGPTMGG